MLTRRGYELRLPGNWPPDTVKVNGAAATFSFEGNTLTTVVRVPPGVGAVKIEVHVNPAVAAREALLDGFAGKIQRLRECYDVLNAQTRQQVWSPDVLIGAWQTGDRLSYQPKTAGDELERFGKSWPEVIAAVEKLKADHPGASAERVMALLNDAK
jgi:hypothetical protein